MREVLRSRAWKPALLLGAAAALFSGCETRSGRSDASPLLLQAFQGGCASSKGRWTDAALSQSQALSETLKSLKDTDPCNKLVTQLATIQNASDSINMLLNDPSFRDFRVKEEYLRELSLSYASATDPTVQAELQAAIAQVQVGLAQSRAESAVSKSELREDRIKLYSRQLTQYTQQLLEQTADLNSCLRNHPEVGVEIATNLIAMGGSLVSPIYGAGSQVIGTLINLGVEAVRTAATEKAIWDLYQVQMPTALACGLEAMTELHCQASETYDLVSMHADARESEIDGKENPAWEGLEIYAEGLPNLVEWLRELKNGLPPDNIYESERQNDAESKVNTIKAHARSVHAKLSQQIRLFEKESDPREQEAILVNVLVNRSFDLAPGLNTITRGSQGFSGLSKNPNQFACWFVKGYGAVQCESVTTDTNPSEATVQAYVRKELLSELMANYRLLSQNWDDMVEAATRNAESEYYDTLSIDPRVILQKARENQAAERSPLAVLQQIEEFLSEMEENPKTPRNRMPLLRSTLQLVREAITEIEVPDSEDVVTGGEEETPLDPEERFMERLRKLYDTFRLKDGPQFFIERIGTFVLWDVTDRLNRGEMPRDATDILRYLGGDIRERLLAPGHDNIQAIADDLSAARQITEGNIDVFRDFFRTSLAKSIGERATRAKPPLENAVGANRPNGQMLGKLCALVLVSGRDDGAWPAEIPWELCAKASYYYPGDPAKTPKIELTKLRDELRSAADQTRNYRMCGYHRYLRETRIREILADLKQERPLAARSVGMVQMPFSLSEGFLNFIQSPFGN